MFEYEQISGKLRNAADEVIGIGYSGAMPDGKNNPAMEGVHNIGPIPCGQYKIIGPPVDTPKHGPYVLRLEPDETTRARIVSLGRDPDSFLMHGDSTKIPGTASEGCIIVSRGVRELVWRHNPRDPYLEVVSGIQSPYSLQPGAPS